MYSGRGRVRGGYGQHYDRGFMVRPYGASRFRGRGPRRGGFDGMHPAGVVFNNGEQVPMVGSYGGARGGIRGGFRPPMNGGQMGYRGNRRPMRVRSQSENYASSQGDEDAPAGPRNSNIPSRPLTRVVARARARSLSASKQEGGVPSVANNAGSGLPDRDAYRMEVNEYVSRNGGGTNQASRTIPCVTVRDMHTFIPDRKQRRIWVPVAVCDELVRALKKCRTAENGPYDVSQLEPSTFICPVTKKLAEVERIEEKTRLRTYMDVPAKDEFKEGDLIEVIELRNELMGRLIKFLDDVATRYRKVGSQMSIPSLYSYSGERRFYYDLRETRWGLRLHISQVTDLHRNVIGIPLESVVDFRDRLNQVIDFLNLSNEEKSDGRQRTTSGRKKPKKGKSGRRRSYSNKSKDKKGAVSGEEDVKGVKGEEEGADQASERVAAGDLPQQIAQES